MESSGLLLRRYGGAIALPSEITETKAAAMLIRDHNRIIIDSGQTTSALVSELAHKKGLVVMTNALSIANEIHVLKEPTLLKTGGTWDANSEAFQGQVAKQVLRSYAFDQLFIGAGGIG